MREKEKEEALEEVGSLIWNSCHEHKETENKEEA